MRPLRLCSTQHPVVSKSGVADDLTESANKHHQVAEARYRDPASQNACMQLGHCPLCKRTIEIVSSHLIPARVYDYCRPPGDHTIVVSNDFVGTTDRQTKAYLLCLECENDLNKGGEAWLLPLLAEYDGAFPLYEMLTQYRAEIVQGDASWYSAAHNPGIHCDKLTHFAMGVFWKAAAHSWRGGKNEPLINLGPYAEPVRRFLRSEAPFPEKMALTIVVLPAPVRLITLELPHRVHRKNGINFPFTSLEYASSSPSENPFPKRCESTVLSETGPTRFL